MIDELKEYIERYDKVIWIEDNEDMLCNLTQVFCTSRALKNFQGNILILSTKKINVLESGFSFRILNEDEQEEIRKYYTMYEFSDRFHYFSQSNLYGGLGNYIQTGCMSYEEVFEALLQ